MVVPVLMTSCHVLLILKIGPVTTHTTMMPQASENALVLPVQRVTAAADRSSHRPSAALFLRAAIPSLLGGPHYSAPRAGRAIAGSPTQCEPGARGLRAEQRGERHRHAVVRRAVPIDVAGCLLEYVSEQAHADSPDRRVQGHET